LLKKTTIKSGQLPTGTGRQPKADRCEQEVNTWKKAFGNMPVILWRLA